MSEQLILSVDQGTTGTTVLGFDTHGEVKRRAYAEFPQIYPRPGWVEHDAEVIWETTLRVIEQALQEGDRIVGVGITNQRETTVVWERSTGKPIHNAIVWQCRRTAEMCRDLSPHETLFRERTGLVMDAYFSGTKIRWILDNVPGARERAQAGALCFGTIDSWLIWKLTAGKVHATDYTNASRTLVYDIYQRRWDPDLLDILQIPESMLPGVVPSSGVVGHCEVAPLQGVPIAGIAGDQQASLYGHGCFEKGMVKNTYGTGCFMMKYMGEQAVVPQHGLLATLACDVDGKPVFALEGSVFIAGAAIQWLRDGLGLIETAPQTEAMASALADNGGVYFVPAFVGLGAPYWDAEARGAIVGLTAGAGRAHIVRATLEAIAYQSRDVLEAMSNTSGLPIRELRVDGGASRNNFLAQFQADQLNITVLRGREVEKTAEGAAVLAGRALNFWARQDRVLGEGDHFNPTMAEGERARLYAGWKQAVARVR